MLLCLSSDYLYFHNHCIKPIFVTLKVERKDSLSNAYSVRLGRLHFIPNTAMKLWPVTVSQSNLCYQIVVG